MADTTGATPTRAGPTGQQDGHIGPESPDPLAAVRAELVAFGRRMAADGLAEGTSGNLSARAGDVIAMTPSGMPYQSMTPADICLVRAADGRPASGRRASTETPMHLAVYRATAAAAVVHTHSAFVVALSKVLDELPAVH